MIEASATRNPSTPRTRSCRVDDRALVRAHAAGSDRVIDRIGVLADEGARASPDRHGRSRRDTGRRSGASAGLARIVWTISTPRTSVSRSSGSDRKFGIDAAARRAMSAPDEPDRCRGSSASDRRRAATCRLRSGACDCDRRPCRRRSAVAGPAGRHRAGS